MAEDLDDGEFWLPSQFLTDEDDDHHHHHHHHPHLLMNKIQCIRFGSYGGSGCPLSNKRPSSPVESAMMSSTTLKERDNRENQHLTGSTCQIPHSKQKERVMPGSPKSPLCDIGNWSAFSSSSSCGGSSRGSPICSSLVSSPPSLTPQNVKQEDPLDLLNAAAGQIGRLKMNEEEGQPRHNHHSDPGELLGPHRKPITPVSSKVKNLPNNVGLYSNQALIQQQLQEAHQFQQLKQQQQLFKQQQQLLKQQLSAVWGQQGKVVVPALMQQQVQNSRTCARPLVMASSSSTCQPLHQKQGSGTSRESCGTGVFIPRRRSIPAAETRKKPAGCPAVLVPAKVVQAHSLSFNAMGGDTVVFTSNEHVKCSSSTFQQTRTASDAVILSGQQQYPPNVASHEICLPKEWTY